MDTIYSIATSAINVEIDKYLHLIDKSDSFIKLEEDIFEDKGLAELFAGGLGIQIDTESKDYKAYLISEFNRKAAVDFDVENAVTLGVYKAARQHAIDLYDMANELTENFESFEEDVLFENPEILPVLQNLLGLSKAQLVRKVGSVSDSRISRPASKKLAHILTEKISGTKTDKNNTLQRLEITIEGIVRDLVGRVLFEEVVANALTNAGVPFLREDDYSGISGVVYSNRADFVIPNEKNPIAFIEVRKSSSRHASLYAKDKMFSAINWKGQHKNLIGVIIVEGDWTQATLQTMASIFDYVVPLSKSKELANTLKKAVDGDDSVLKWLIEFSITKSPKFN